VKAFRLFAIRHGETDWSRERRFAGSRDIPLAATGRVQSDAVARALAPSGLTGVYASPLERARTSAEVIAKPHRLEVTIEPAFREMAFGAWEGLTRAEAAARFPDEIAVWSVAPQLATPPGGEPLTAVAARVATALHALVERHAGETVALVSHAIVTRLLVLAALGLGPERLWSVDASPGGITEIEYQGAWVTVHRMNTLAHLDALEDAP
jgi:broad specificity phosphatase PhoE